MDLLQKRNWWVWLLLFMVTGGTIPSIMLAAMLNCYDKDAWYAQWTNWFIALLCLVFPVLILLQIFVIESLCMVAEKLDVPNAKLYTSSIFWIVCVFVPFIGWLVMSFMILYLHIYILVQLSRGKGEEAR